MTKKQETPVAYKEVAKKLSDMAEKTTNREENEIVVILGTTKHKYGYRVLAPEAMDSAVDCVSIELDKGLRGAEMVTAYRKACMAVLGGEVDPDTFEIKGVQGTNDAEGIVDKRMDSQGTAAKIIALNWPGIKKGEKKARGNNGKMNNITFTGAVMGRTDKIKVPVDTVIGCKVLKVVLVCEGMEDIEYAPDEEHMARANAISDEIMARIEGDIEKVNMALNKSLTKKDKAIQALAKAHARAKKAEEEANMAEAKNAAIERQLKMQTA